MGKIQINSGHASSATHRLTQASTTLNRRYVRRPSNIAVEEAARSSIRATEPQTPTAPSRLVNLRVSADELRAAQLQEAEAKKAIEPSATDHESIDSEPDLPESRTFTPAIIELGRVTPELSDTQDFACDKNTTDNSAVDAVEAENTTSNDLPALPLQTEPAAVETASVSLENNNIDVPNDSDNLNAGLAASSYAPMVIDSPIDQEQHDATTLDNTLNGTAEIDTATLAMNIAADYAAASLGASVKEYGDNYQNYALESATPTTLPATTTNNSDSSNTNISADSVDAIARAASEAIASIRVATEPSEVSEQISSLQAFANNIKSQQSMPEMRELGDTIDKFISIAKKSSGLQDTSKNSTTSLALSPKANRAAAKVTKSSAKVMQAHTRTKHTAPKAAPARPIATTKFKPSTTHRTQLNASSPSVPKFRQSSSKTFSERSLESTLRSVATAESGSKSRTKPQPALSTKRKGGTKRFVIAIACAAICVFGVISFVTSNMPDISVRVAAMQTGIEASYPSYIPRDYSLSDINSESGKITMQFEGPDDSSFTLVEEKSSWDSSALLRNYVEPTWNEDYTTTHEQGITIYIANINSDAAWVNGGVLYKITSSGTPLTKKQVRNIVTSL